MKREYYLFGLLMLVLIIIFSYESYYYTHGMHHRMMGGMMSGSATGFGMGFGWIFWILVIVFVYLLLKDRSEGRVTKEDDAVEILKKRYAKGEIDRDEYIEILRDLIEKRE